MDNKVITKNIDVELKNTIESYDYEYSTRRDAIAFMLTNNMDITTDSFKSYQKEMIEFNVKFSKAKAELERIYVLPVTEGKKVNWSLDYETSVLTITFID